MTSCALRRPAIPAFVPEARCSVKATRSTQRSPAGSVQVTRLRCMCCLCRPSPAGNYLPHPHGHRANAPYVKALGEQLAARGDRGEAAGAGGATVTGAGMGRRDEQAGAGAGAEDPSVAAAEGEGGGVAGVREAKGEGERAPESGVVVPPAPPLPLVALQRGHLGVFTADHVLMGVLTMQQFR